MAFLAQKLMSVSQVVCTFFSICLAILLISVPFRPSLRKSIIFLIWTRMPSRIYQKPEGNRIDLEKKLRNPDLEKNRKKSIQLPRRFVKNRGYFRSRFGICPNFFRQNLN